MGLVHSEFFWVGKSYQNSSKPVLIFWSSIPCVFCIMLKVVSYYDLSVLSMSVMGFQFFLVALNHTPSKHFCLET